MEHDEKLQELATELVQRAWPVISTRTKADPSVATVKSVLAPYLRQALKQCVTDSKGPDGRSRAFLVTAQFYDMARGKDAAVLIGETEGAEQITGQHAVLEAISEWIAELHQHDELSEDAAPEEVAKKHASLRSMLSRGGGICTIRVHYEADGVPHLAQVRVKRGEDDGAE